MSTTHSLLGHLVTRFAPKPENLATESLAYILEKSPCATRSLMAFLKQLEVPLPETLRFHAQERGADGSIPDLVGTDSDGKRVVIIEAKFWAPLTDNQPVKYLNHLPPSSDAILLFIAPAVRSTLLWTELLSRCKEGVPFVAEKDNVTFPEVKTRKIGQYHTLALSSWRALLTHLLEALHVEGDTVAASDIVQLQGLCERMDDDAFLPLRSEELNSSIGSRFIQFCRLVDDVARRVVDEHVGNFYGNISRGNGIYWRPMTINGCGCYLTVNSEYWSQLRSTPIWMTVQDRGWKIAGDEVKDALWPLKIADPPRVLYYQNQVLVPMRLLLGVERPSVVENLFSQVYEVAHLLQKLDSVPAETSNEDVGLSGHE